MKLSEILAHVGRPPEPATTLPTDPAEPRWLCTYRERGKLKQVFVTGITTESSAVRTLIKTLHVGYDQIERLERIA